MTFDKFPTSRRHRIFKEVDSQINHKSCAIILSIIPSKEIMPITYTSTKRRYNSIHWRRLVKHIGASQKYWGANGDNNWCKLRHFSIIGGACSGCNQSLLIIICLQRHCVYRNKECNSVTAKQDAVTSSSIHVILTAYEQLFPNRRYISWPKRCSKDVSIDWISGAFSVQFRRTFVHF